MAVNAVVHVWPSDRGVHLVQAWQSRLQDATVKALHPLAVIVIRLLL